MSRAPCCCTLFQWLALSGMVDFRAVAFLAALAISGEQLTTFLFIVPFTCKYNTMQLVLYYHDKSLNSGIGRKAWKI